LDNPGLTRTTAPYAAGLMGEPDFVPQTIIATDIASLSLLPDNALGYAGGIDLVIDHHPSNERFAKENLVRGEAAACGEIVYDLLKILGDITAEIALPLYVAISTDTGCFQYSNTTTYTHYVTSKLMETGMDVHRVNKIFFGTKSRKRLALEGEMLRTMESFAGGRVVLLKVPMELMEKIGADEGDAEDLNSLGAMVEGCHCSVTMRQLKPQTWKFSVRTSPDVNANAICQRLGGGGHNAAAGCTLDGEFLDVKEKMLESVEQETGTFQN
jgi:phosphoesterase RecJ-like protein